MICRHFGVCGGCSLPGMDYAAQLALKGERLRGWFPDAPVAPVLPSPRVDGFRQKVAFVFTPDSASPRIVMGHYEARSQRVVAVEECPVHADRGNRLAFALRDRLAAGRVPAGVLRHVLVRVTADQREAALVLVVRENHPALRAPIRSFIESPDRPDGLFVNINDRPGPYMVGPRTLRISGRGQVREEVLDTSFLVSPTAFFQTNVWAARELLRLVLEEVGAAARVLDLYSGAGLFTLPLARQGARVVAVEENRQAVKDAEANLALNRVRGGAVRLVAARVEDAMERLSREAFDVIVLDPPRQGCPDRVIDAVTAMGTRKLVYISCNPEQLAGETRQFERRGYRLSRLQPVDMFPHTEHIEAMAVFIPVAPARGSRTPAGRRAGRPSRFRGMRT